ncbi:RNA polymerase sigma factor [Arthrospiribacter ruber]|uniref:RNA polymerase sigma factor n=1 Tax=Arthrospiribacter ruber TaxID=2487934 RepID=A0A951IWK0_9BACT|nr:RNA polymerase sigma factor [Arthrospiribacter ruber]MBW3466938.1 RNA polymerase sigma factor [Arthrospiribacter ruber]
MSLQDRFLEEIKSNHRIIRKVCLVYARTKDDQEDLFQECLYNAWKAFPGFRGDAKFSSWLYRVSLNTALYHKRKSQSAYLEVDFDLAQYPFVEQKEEDSMAQLYQAIAVLNAVEKSIILLYLEDLSYREIGEITGFSETNVGAKLSRIKGKLKTIIIKNGS